MSAKPDLSYASRLDDRFRPSWTRSDLYLNREHERIFERVQEIPGWLNRTDALKLFELGYYCGDVILEIGVYAGKSATTQMLGALSNPKRSSVQYYGVDIDPSIVAPATSTFREYGLESSAFLFTGILEEFFREVGIAPSLVFVDGDHTYAGVKPDLVLLSKYLPPGTPVLVHDYSDHRNIDGEYGVTRACLEWEASGYVEYLGLFACSALYVTTDRCGGKEPRGLPWLEFDARRTRQLQAVERPVVSIEPGEPRPTAPEAAVNNRESLIDSYLPRIENKLLEAKKYVNLLRALEARRRRSLVVRHVPYEITLDATTVCQLSCPYCTTGNGTIKRTKAILRPEMHRSMIAECADRLFIVWYFSTGEPLLNKNIADIIGQTKGREVFSIISTNLSMELSEERLQALVGSGLGLLTVSLDGATPDTYGKYRRGGDFDLVIKNMRRIVRIKRELGLHYPLVMWRFLLFEHNAYEARDVLRLAREWGVDLVEFFPGSTPEHIVDPEAVRPFKGERPVNDFTSSFLEAAWRRRDTPIRRLGVPPAEPGGPAVPQVRSKCDWLYFGSMLFPTGAVGPCCVSNDEPDDFGNLAEESLVQIYNNERYRTARRVMRGENSEYDIVCSRCPNPAAPHFQFRLTLRSILLNAPAWVLKILGSDSEQYIDPVDRLVLPNVISLIESEDLARSVGRFTPAELREIYAELDALAIDDDRAVLDFVEGLSSASMR